MPKGTMDRDFQQLASLFRLLSDQTRLHILFLLASGERNVTALCAELHLPQPTVSHHLGLLRTSHIIANRRNGKLVYYALNESVNVSNEHDVRIDLEKFAVHITSN